MYIFDAISNCLTVYLYSAGKKNHHDAVANRAYILELGTVTNNTSLMLIYLVGVAVFIRVRSAFRNKKVQQANKTKLVQVIPTTFF
jgi:hypothetical protein